MDQSGKIDEKFPLVWNRDKTVLITQIMQAQAVISTTMMVVEMKLFDDFSIFNFIIIYAKCKFLFERHESL